MVKSNFDIEKWFEEKKSSGQCGLLMLIDPDRETPETLAKRALQGQNAGVDAILVGSSILIGSGFCQTVISIKEKVDIPVFIFPGKSDQLTSDADGVFFLSLISGRNPRWLIEEQVCAAPQIKRMGLSTLSVAYMLIESGQTTAVEFMSNTRPIPANKPDIVIAHVLAAEMMGFKCVFLEAGSGAENPVSGDLIRKIKSVSDINLIVGGGIRTLKSAKDLSSNGANFVVMGNVFENNSDQDFLKKIVDTIKS